MAIDPFAAQKLNAAQTNIGWAKGFAVATANNTLLTYCRATCDHIIADLNVAIYVLGSGSTPAGQDVITKLESSRGNTAWAKAFAANNATTVSKQYARAFLDHANSDISAAEALLAAADDDRTDWIPANPYAAPAVGDFPTLATAGLAEPTALTSYYGALQPGPGQTVENLDINGRVDMASGVTLRNCRVRTDDYYVVRVTDGLTGMKFEDCEFDGLNGICNAVLGGGNGSWTMRRTYIHGGEDAIKITDNCTIRDSYLTNNGGSGSDPHFDEIQCMAGQNIDIVHNYLEVPAAPGNTSAIFLKTDFGFANPINDVHIAYNWLNGGSHTFTHYAGTGGPPTNVRLIYNRFGPRHDYGYMNIQGTLAANVGNVFM